MKPAPREELMEKIANILTGVVAGLHLCFMIIEMFLWQTDFSLKALWNDSWGGRSFSCFGSKPGVIQWFFGLWAYLDVFYSEFKLKHPLNIFPYLYCHRRYFWCHNGGFRFFLPNRYPLCSLYLPLDGVNVIVGLDFDELDFWLKMFSVRCLCDFYVVFHSLRLARK